MNRYKVGAWLTWAISMVSWGSLVFLAAEYGDSETDAWWVIVGVFILIYGALSGPIWAVRNAYFYGIIKRDRQRLDRMDHKCLDKANDRDRQHVERLGMQQGDRQ